MKRILDISSLNFYIFLFFKIEFKYKKLKSLTEITNKKYSVSDNNRNTNGIGILLFTVTDSISIRKAISEYTNY